MDIWESVIEQIKLYGVLSLGEVCDCSNAFLPEGAVHTSKDTWLDICNQD